MTPNEKGRPATATPQELHCWDYTALRRLERVLRREARIRQLPGDPLNKPRLGTLREHQTALQLWANLPPDLRRHILAWPMTQATVGRCQ